MKSKSRPRCRARTRRVATKRKTGKSWGGSPWEEAEPDAWSIASSISEWDFSTRNVSLHFSCPSLACFLPLLLSVKVAAPSHKTEIRGSQAAASSAQQGHARGSQQHGVPWLLDHTGRLNISLLLENVSGYPAQACPLLSGEYPADLLAYNWTDVMFVGAIFSNSTERAACLLSIHVEDSSALAHSLLLPSLVSTGNLSLFAGDLDLQLSCGPSETLRLTLHALLGTESSGLIPPLIGEFLAAYGRNRKELAGKWQCVTSSV